MLVGFPAYIIVLMLLSSLLHLQIAFPQDVYIAVADFLSDPISEMHYWLTSAEWWLYIGGPVLLIAHTQLLFLVPTVKPPVVNLSRGKSLLLSVVLAGMAGALLTVALVLVLASFISAVTLDSEGMLAGGSFFKNHELWMSPLWIIIPLMVSWPLWCLALMRFARRQPTPTLPDRLIGVLFAGTLLEWLVLVPLDIMVRRRTDCYCATGSFHGLWFATCATLWLAGPGIFLLLTSKRRRTWGTTHCINCGYAKGPSPSDACPECGSDWLQQETNQ